MNQKQINSIIVFFDQPIEDPDLRMYKGHLNTKGVDVVVKVISKQEYQDYEKRIEREKKGLISNLTITHVINFEGIENPPRSQDYYIAYENFECTLESLVRKNYKLNGNIQIDILKILRDAIDGISYIHKNNMTHRDIHPSNIMICPMNHTLVGKISNLALSKEFKPCSSVQSVSQEFKANGFVAPELCDFNGPYLDGVDRAVDIFSMGCVMFFALTREYLFANRGTEMQSNIKDENFIPAYDALDDTELLKEWQIQFSKQLIKKMILRNPNERPSACDVLNYPLFWDKKQIAEFFETVSASILGDNDLKKLINGDDLEYDDWGKNLHDEMKIFIMQGTRGKNVMYGASNLVRFIRNLLAHCKDKNKEYLRNFLHNQGNGSAISYILEVFPGIFFYVYQKAEAIKNESSLKEFY